MKQYFITVSATAIRQSEKAFMCSFVWEDEHLQFDERWVPLSVIDESCHDDISDAGDGDVIEIYIAKWWLNKNS